MSRSGKHWTPWEDQVLRKALREGGVPLACKHLKGRSYNAIRARSRALEIDLMSLGPVRLATATEVEIALDLTPNSANSRVNHNVLVVRRGKYKAIPACHLEAMRATRPPPLEALPGYLTGEQAAALLGVSKTHLRLNLGPHIPGRRSIRVPGGERGMAWAYPEGEIYSLLRQRQAA